MLTGSTVAPTSTQANRPVDKHARAEASSNQLVGTGRIVAIDDDPLTLRLVSSHMQRAGRRIQTAANGTAGLKLIDDSTAVALVDLRMPEMNGFQVLQHIRESNPRVKVIVLTGSEEVSDAVQAMREGAFQFITKPFDPEELIVYVEKAIESWRVASENQDLRESHSQDVRVRDLESSGDMHGRLMEQVHQIATLDSTVFIGGETGTGKSTIARMIHQRSKRAEGPFVTVNCASLPRDLIQSELFGHTKGSFTGAVKDRMGHAEFANGGTLFLDEIGDLPIDLQPKLLTFLQDRTIRRLGSTETKSVDVRLITATHCDLAAMCRAGLFRQDLYFRLLVLNLEIPALRFRSGEFANIVSGILTAICERQSVALKPISENAMQLLVSHSWPGNIRELENVLERAIAFSQLDTIEPQDLLFNNVSLDRRRPDLAFGAGPEQHADMDSVSAKSNPGSTARFTTGVAEAPSESHFQLAGKTLEEIEREAIIQTLDAFGGNKAKTARMLGISEKSIYNKMRRLNITR